MRISIFFSGVEMLVAHLAWRQRPAQHGLVPWSVTVLFAKKNSLSCLNSFDIWNNHVIEYGLMVGKGCFRLQFV